MGRTPQGLLIHYTQPQGLSCSGTWDEALDAEAGAGGGALGVGGVDAPPLLVVGRVVEHHLQRRNAAL